MAYNNLPIDERVKRGKEKEAKIIKYLREEKNWKIVPSTPEEDMKQKIDAWIGDKAIQIKTREDDREDLGVALFQPWEEAVFLDLWKTPRRRELCWDRDVVNPPFAYILHNKQGLIIAKSVDVQTIYHRTLDDLYKDDGFSGKQTSYRPYFTGSELRHVVDAASGRNKLICYITPPRLFDSGAQFIKADI